MVIAWLNYLLLLLLIVFKEEGAFDIYTLTSERFFLQMLPFLLKFITFSYFLFHKTKKKYSELITSLLRVKGEQYYLFI